MRVRIHACMLQLRDDVVEQMFLFLRYRGRWRLSVQHERVGKCNQGGAGGGFRGLTRGSRNVEVTERQRIGGVKAVL